MPFTNTRENGLEALIVKWLVEHNDYEEGNNADYNKEYAIDETRLFRFLQDTQPDQMDKLGVFKSEQKKRQFLNRLQGELAKRGIIDVLRIAEVDVDLLRRGLAVFFLTLVNDDFADEGSQHFRRQLLNAYILFDDVKELLHIGTFIFECINFFLQVRNSRFKLFLFIVVIN